MNGRKKQGQGVKHHLRYKQQRIEQNNFTSLKSFISGFFWVSVGFHVGFDLGFFPGSAAGAAALNMFETTSQSCIGVWFFISDHGIPLCHKWIGQHGPCSGCRFDTLEATFPNTLPEKSTCKMITKHFWSYIWKISEMIVTKNWWWSTTKLERFYLVLSFWLSDVACELDAQRIVSADSTDQTSFNLVNVESPVAIMDDNSKMGSVILEYPRAI